MLRHLLTASLLVLSPALSAAWSTTSIDANHYAQSDRFAAIGESWSTLVASFSATKACAPTLYVLNVLRPNDTSNPEGRSTQLDQDIMLFVDGTKQGHWAEVPAVAIKGDLIFGGPVDWPVIQALAYGNRARLFIGEAGVDIDLTGSKAAILRALGSCLQREKPFAPSPTHPLLTF